MPYNKLKVLALTCLFASLTLAGKLYGDRQSLARLMHRRYLDNDGGSLSLVHSVSSERNGAVTNKNSSVNIRQKFKDPLESFVAVLRSFVHGNKFAVERFEENAPMLEKHFGMITRSGEAIYLDNETAQQFRFAKSMFEEMVDAIELLKYYDITGSMAFHLVHCMIELNIRLLTLFNSLGLPDPHLPGYAYKVTQFSELATYWDQEFNLQPGVSYGVRQIFRKHGMKAMKTIADLATHIGGSRQLDQV